MNQPEKVHVADKIGLGQVIAIPWRKGA